MGMHRKYSEKELEIEADKLLEWSLFDSSLRLYGFANDKDYCYDDFDTFAARCKKFKLALKKSKERLALRREEASIDGLLPKHIYDKTAHIYDKEMVRASEQIESDQEKRKHKLKLKEIEWSEKIKAEFGIADQTPPTDDLNDANHANMQLRNENKELKKLIEELKNK